MLWKWKKLNYPEEELDGERYYLVKPNDVANLNGYNVKFEGVVDAKPTVIYYAAGWPWSISSRLVEEDHGHRTILKVSGVEVYFKGVAAICKGEKVVVYGKVKDGRVEAKLIEGQCVTFKSM
ncbi:MAG: hypothetical protein NDF55_01040 [archaeon GB-1867-005]|nr:hypothetical protein [Candidatus Culexmicrobium cathedralense]